MFNGIMESFATVGTPAGASVGECLQDDERIAATERNRADRIRKLLMVFIVVIVFRWMSANPVRLRGA